MTTFVRPLLKKGTGALDSMFNAQGYKAVGEVYRNRLGGPPFPIAQHVSITKWVCNTNGCTAYRDTDGEYKGVCPGYCV